MLGGTGRGVCVRVCVCVRACERESPDGAASLSLPRSLSLALPRAAVSAPIKLLVDSSRPLSPPPPCPARLRASARAAALYAAVPAAAAAAAAAAAEPEAPETLAFCQQERGSPLPEAGRLPWAAARVPAAGFCRLHGNRPRGRRRWCCLSFCSGAAPWAWRSLDWAICTLDF